MNKVMDWNMSELRKFMTILLEPHADTPTDVQKALRTHNIRKADIVMWSKGDVIAKMHSAVKAGEFVYEHRGFIVRLTLRHGKVMEYHFDDKELFGKFVADLNL